MELTGEIPSNLPAATTVPERVALYAVIYVSPTDAHIQSIHADYDKAILCCEDQARHMRQWRREYFNFGMDNDRKPAAYVVVEVPILHGCRVE